MQCSGFYQRDSLAVHSKVISGCKGLRQARVSVTGPEPATKGRRRSQGGFAIDYAADAPIKSKDRIAKDKHLERLAA
ncbi:hypothetical protein PoB_005519600 [Plakobranchus ocellatus]|uniref:Uncharacterized protein n=1 Tax=Plakobranchus ocellatus TaxID=259542 RepID=A0AAV4BZZ1_9GAST|nr:hypothetical protein PoB_005519600 [Plakobranchus ocellatus]